MIKSLLFSLLLINLVTYQASAKSMWKPNFGPPPFPISVSVLRAFGDGCPQGSVSTAMTADQTSVSILFDQLLTDVPASPSPLVVRRTCSVTLNVRFSGQYRVAIVGTDVNGFVHVPAMANTNISIKHWSMYMQQPKTQAKMDFQKTFNGPIEQNVTMNSRFPDIPLWSQCGTQMKYTNDYPFMTVNIDINSTNQNSEESLLAAIDSLDFSANGLTYQLAWTADTKNCPR